MEDYSSQNPPFSESTRPPPVTYPAAFGVWILELLWILVLGAWSLDHIYSYLHLSTLIYTSRPVEPVRASPNHVLPCHFTYIHLHSLKFTYFPCNCPRHPTRTLTTSAISRHLALAMSRDGGG